MTLFCIHAIKDNLISFPTNLTVLHLTSSSVSYINLTFFIYKVYVTCKETSFNNLFYTYYRCSNVLIHSRLWLCQIPLILRAYAILFWNKKERRKCFMLQCFLRACFRYISHCLLLNNYDPKWNKSLFDENSILRSYIFMTYLLVFIQ